MMTYWRKTTSVAVEVLEQDAGAVLCFAKTVYMTIKEL